MINTTIWFTFQKEGIHCYPRAAIDPNLADVSFLASPHRHIFHFRIDIKVFHDDRDIEFIQAKRYTENLFTSGALQMDYKSCEMLAREVLAELVKKYPERGIKISVSEDNENGAVVEMMPRVFI